MQAVLFDYVEAQSDLEKLRQLADLMKEKMPALLASREGLKVACALFALLEAKDRKVVVKSLPVEEMLTNKIAHLFLIYVANTLDDTQLTKKKILHEALIKVDDLIDDPCYQNFLMGALSPLEPEKDEKTGVTTLRAPYLMPEDSACFHFLYEKSTSKKDWDVRARELYKLVSKPLENFFEEKLQF